MIIQKHYFEDLEKIGLKFNKENGKYEYIRINDLDIVSKITVNSWDGKLEVFLLKTEDLKILYKILDNCYVKLE